MLVRVNATYRRRRIAFPGSDGSFCERGSTSWEADRADLARRGLLKLVDVLAETAEPAPAAEATESVAETTEQEPAQSEPAVTATESVVAETASADAAVDVQPASDPVEPEGDAQDAGDDGDPAEPESTGSAVEPEKPVVVRGRRRRVAEPTGE